MESCSILEAHEFINQNSRFLIVGHVDPDGDCISSLLTLSYGLRRINKEAIPVVDSKRPGFLKDFPPAGTIGYSEEVDTADYDAIITVDLSSIDRMGMYEEETKSKKTLVIDHHATNTFFGDLNLVDTSAAAAVQIIYKILNETGITFDTVLSTVTLLGIQTDTGFFKYTNTTGEVFRIAGELVEKGAEPYFNASMVLENNRVEEFYLLSEMTGNIVKERDGELIYSSINKEMFEKTDCTYEDSTGMISELRSIRGVETAVLFTEVQKEEIKVSFRSKRWFDVAGIALEFGGGGHARASGCTIKNEPLETVIKKVIKRVSEEMEKATY